MVTGKNSYTLNVDIKQRMSNKTPRFVQYDSAQIIFKIYDSGKQYDLTPFTSAIVTHRLPDGKTIAGQAEFTELNGQRVVVYDYMGSEMEQEGNIETSVGLFVGDTQKVSIMPFNVEIVDDLGDHIDEDVEAKYSVLQVMIGEVTELNATMTANENTRQSNEATRRSQEIQRQTNEDTRKSNENTRISNENTRKANEDTRKSDETARQSAEDTRVANETARVSAEDTRKANEAERQKQEGIRNTSETERLSNENARVSAENTRESQESTRQTQESTRQTNTNNAIARLDTAVDSTKLEFKAPVETKAALSTTYSNAQVGWVAQVTTGEDAGKFFRYNGSTWEFQSEIALDAVTDIQNKLHRTDRKTETLIDGVNIIDAPVASPTDIEIQGRTMVSLGNSNLEKGKYYALTDEKYKVITDGKTVSGVGKFQKGETHKTTADFTGKVAKSLTENPHKFTGASLNRMYNPITEGFSDNVSQGAVNSIMNLDSLTSNYASTSGVGYFAQQIFSFDVVSQVERTIGIIPGETLAEKIAWLKTNASRLAFRWYGYGSGPGGNKATVTAWIHSGSAWNSNSISHSDPTVRMAMFSSTSPTSYIDENGYMHFVAYAEPSDGSTTSSVNTDFVSLELELAPTAQLNTRPTIVRVENFEGKVSGSTVENPHTIKYEASASATELQPPTFNAFNELGGSSLDSMKKLDGSTYANARVKSGVIAQMLFSFNLIEAVERNVGKIPASDTAGKVDWLKNNLQRLYPVWYGYGVGPEGFKATVGVWNGAGWLWQANHTASTTNRRAIAGLVEGVLHRYVDDGGFLHFIAYAEPSDGSTPSSIYTDYMELEIHLKPTADFRQPRVPLYEVTKDEYDRIGVSQTDEETKRRYPIVQGVQHLVNPYVVNPGENLLPPFTDSKWNIHRDATVNNAHELYLKPTSVTRSTNIKINVTPGQPYTLSYEGDGETSITLLPMGEDGRNIQTELNRYENYTKKKTITFTPYKNSPMVMIYVGNHTEVSEMKFKNLMLTPGTEPKPFTPYNPSTLHAPVTLSAVGDKRDLLYQQDGRWYVRRAVREVEFTGDYGWKSHPNNDAYSGFKWIQIPKADTEFGYLNYADGYAYQAYSYKGHKLQNALTSYNAIGADEFHTSTAAGSTFRITVADKDTGFPSSYIPSDNEVKMYLNGWRYTDGTTWESVTGNGQTATAEEALTTKPDDYTPYKLTYTLATPEVIDVTELVEGDIAVSGLTQIEVGSDGIVHKEKLGFVLSGNGYYEANKLSNTDTHLDFSLGSVISIHKGRDIFDKYRVVSAVGYWKDGLGIQISPEDFDENAEYFATYKVKDKSEFTVAPDKIKITYEQNIRSAHDALVNDVVQNTSLLSIHERAIVNLFARIRGLELSADEIRQDLDDLRTDFDNLPEPTPPTDGGTA